MTTSPDSPLFRFKKFRDYWKSRYTDKIQSYREKLPSCLTVCEIDNLLEFYLNELTKEIVRDDYRELIELSITLLDGDTERKFKIRPPGAKHHARWMALPTRTSEDLS